MSVSRSAAISASDVVGGWEQPPRVFVCPPPQDASDPCGCGYDGPWERRTVFIWHNVPGTNRGDKTVRRDLARGFPARYGDEGWWVIGGFDERCPRCGDIERYAAWTHELISASTTHRTAVIPLSPEAMS